MYGNNNISLYYYYMIWGKYTWYFFHTMAEKIKEEEFYNNRELLFAILKQVCGVLPCPTCRAHAVQSLKTVRWDQINTKNDFKKFIFRFHNKINTRKRIKPETVAALEKFKSANFNGIITAFSKAFNTKVPQLMSEQMNRRMVVNDVLNKIRSNRRLFNS